MCGIFGIYFFDKSKQVDEHLVRDATNEMTHRGPDSCGFYVHQNIGLGHRRLSIIDLASGDQPMFNEDNRLAIVFNGEIYNYREIRDTLTKRGHQFRTQSDTEVIIHAYEEWGAECLQQFNGMFAFAIWDDLEKSIWIVRDRLGIKPLYYYFDHHVFIFSSEIKPILKTGYVQAKINEKALDVYFSLGYVPGPQTMFANIFKLKPGNFIKVQNGSVQIKEYWDFAQIPKTEMDFNAAREQIASLLDDSVKKRLVSDVPLGAFLSGGIDSSAVVSIMSHMQHYPVDTFTVGYDQKYGISEQNYAELVADTYVTNHHIYNLEPENFFESLKTLVHFCEEPIEEAPAIALFHLAKLARQHATVLLSGEGSDEVFAGYYIYKLMKQVSELQRKIPRSLWQYLPLLRYLIPMMKYQKYFDWFGLPLEQRFFGTSSYLTENIRKKLYTEDFYQAKGNYLQETFVSHYEKVNHQTDIINKMLYVDTKTWLVDRLLLKADKMTMAASIELRVPFLDFRLVEFAAGLPSTFKLHNGAGKYILKSIMTDKLPEAIIHRTKMGFPVPTKHWFHNELFQEVERQLVDPTKLPWLKREAVKKMIRQHRAGVQDFSQLLMTLLVFIFWQREYV